MGACLAAANATAMAGRSGKTLAAFIRYLRSELLPVPRKQARRRSTNAAVYGNVCIRQRFSRAAARWRLATLRRGGFACGGKGTWNLPGSVFLAAPRSDDSADERPRTAWRRRCLD